MDRKDLLAYLDGETNTCANIDKYAPLEITMAAPIHLGPGAAKRPKIDSHETSASSVAATQISSQSHAQKMSGDAEELTSGLNSEIRERIAKKLEAGVVSGAGSVSKIAADQISDLSDKLTAEKIKELKTIRLAKKRNTIVSGDVMDDDLPVVSGVGGTGASADDTEMMKEILGRERIWRNRVTILESVGNKCFDKNIFAILQSIKSKEENNNGAVVMGQGNVAQAQMQAANAAAQKSAKTLGYNRFDQERYGAKDDTGGFSINTKGTYQFNASIALGGAGGAAGEAPVSQASQSQAKLSAIVNTVPSKVPPSAASQLAKPGSASQVSSQSQKARQSRKPIIIVPATRTALITIHNVVDILQDLK